MKSKLAKIKNSSINNADSQKLIKEQFINTCRGMINIEMIIFDSISNPKVFNNKYFGKALKKYVLTKGSGHAQVRKSLLAYA